MADVMGRERFFGWGGKIGKKSRQSNSKYEMNE